MSVRRGPVAGRALAAIPMADVGSPVARAPWGEVHAARGGAAARWVAGRADDDDGNDHAVAPAGTVVRRL